MAIRLKTKQTKNPNKQDKSNFFQENGGRYPKKNSQLSFSCVVITKTLESSQWYRGNFWTQNSLKPH